MSDPLKRVGVAQRFAVNQGTELGNTVLQRPSAFNIVIETPQVYTSA